MQNSVRGDQAVVGQASSGIMGLSVSPWAMGRSHGLHILGNEMQESFHLRDGGVGLKTGFFTLAVLELKFTGTCLCIPSARIKRVCQGAWLGYTHFYQYMVLLLYPM